jgi:hypothetical protein
MTESCSDDLLRSRQEAALLLRLDPSNLSPSDALRCDLISTLRLAIDGEQATVLDGGSADLAKLITATENLIRLLPGRELPAPAEQHLQDPRETLFKIYMQMRERGEVPHVGWHQHRIDALEAEVAALKAQLVGAGLAPALPDVVDRQVGTSGNLKTVITPTEADITPPGEYLGVPPMRGPDDPPKPKRSPCIDGTSAPAAYDYSANQDWKDWIEPDGSIRTTPRGRGKDWGPV